jgi:O-antigen ligase
VSLSAVAPPMSLLPLYRRDQALWTTIADIFAILAALAARKRNACTELAGS